MSAEGLAGLLTAVGSILGLLLGWVLNKRKTKVGFETGWRDELRNENKTLRNQNDELRRYYFYAMELLIKNNITIPDAMKSLQEKVKRS